MQLLLLLTIAAVSFHILWNILIVSLSCGKQKEKDKER